MTATTIKSPLWIKITGYGFAAVLFASAAIGGLAWYHQADMSEKALYSKAASDLEVIQTDMAAIQRSASAPALTLSGEPDIAGYIISNDRQALLNKFSKNMHAMKEAGGLQIITIGNAKGDIIARIHSPENFGDNVIGRSKTIQTAVSTGNQTAVLRQTAAATDNWEEL